MKAMKRSKTSDDVPTVVNALTHCDALPQNLRDVLKSTLPIVLSAYKADRDAFENGVVAQAEQGLKAVEASMDQAAKAALATQNEIITPAERAKRVQAVADAKAHLEAMKAKGENDKNARNAAEQAMEEARKAAAVAAREERSANGVLQRFVDEKDHVTSVLATEFVALRDGTGAAGKAVKTVTDCGNKYGLDSTLLHTLPVTCKKPAADYSEFETMMFTSLEGLLKNVITDLEKKIAEATPAKNEKAATAAAATQASDNAKAAFKAACDEWDNQQKATAEASKAITASDAARRRIWEDMRRACDSADAAAAELKTLKEDVFGAFEKLKEKEPEPEPVEPEPVEEEAPAEEAPAEQAAEAAAEPAAEDAA